MCTELDSGVIMAAGPEDIRRLEEFLDNLPNEPKRKIADKMLWTVWARLYPDDAMTKSEMGMKISTIKLLARPDMNLEKFEKTVEKMKKKLRERLDEINRSEMEEFKKEKEAERKPITMELIDEPLEVEILEVLPLEDDELDEVAPATAKKRVVKRISKKKAVRTKRVKKAKKPAGDTGKPKGEKEKPEDVEPEKQDGGISSDEGAGAPDDVEEVGAEPGKEKSPADEDGGSAVEKKVKRPVGKKVAKPVRKQTKVPRKKAVKPMKKGGSGTGKKKTVKAKKVTKKAVK